MAKKLTGAITIVDGHSIAIDVTTIIEQFTVGGTATLTSNWAVTASGTPAPGTSFRFLYKATITLGGNHISFFGVQMPDIYATKNVTVDCDYNGTTWVVNYLPSFAGSDIVALTNIINKNVSLDKIADLTPNTMLIVNSAGRPIAVALSGAIAISEAGVVTIEAKAIDNTHLADEADIEAVKILASATGRLIYSDPTTGRLTIHSLTEEDLDAIYSTMDDIKTLTGMAAAGVTLADLQKLKDFAAAFKTISTTEIELETGVHLKTTGSQSRNTRSLAGSATLTDADDIVVLSLAADGTLILPDIETVQNKVITVIIKANPGAAYDVTFQAYGTQSISYGGMEVNAATVLTPAINSTIMLVNEDEGYWTIGK